MDLRALKLMFRHHWVTVNRLLDKAELLDAALYRASSGYGLGSAHDIFWHLLDDDHEWRIGLDSGLRPAPLDPADYGDIAALRAGFAHEQAAWDAVLASLKPDDFAAPVTMTPREGYTCALYLGDALNHMMLHGMQHFAELARIFTEHGHSPGDIDLVFLLFEEPVAQP